VIGDVVRELDGGGGVPVGVAVAGMLNPRGAVEHGTNPAWGGLPLAERLRSAFGDLVTVVNDANAAAWDEYEARRHDPPIGLLTVTVGTGIGSGLVHRGELFKQHARTPAARERGKGTPAVPLVPLMSGLRRAG
jgi:glucokinase